MRRIILIAALALLATPAFAQYPPPGIYDCSVAGGAALGKLSLFVAGDYQFDMADGTSGKGQVSSAGNTVEALSGPLADIHLKGSFATQQDKTTFGFTSDKGKLACLPPAS